MDRQEKSRFIEEFSESCSRHSCMIVVRQEGLSASAVFSLRREARAAGAIFRVVPNRLAKRALQGEKQVLDSCFSGPVGVFFSQDPVSVSRVIESFGKKRQDQFFPLGGVLSGRSVSAEEILKMATLPSLPELRAKLVGCIKMPLINVVSLMKESARRTVCVLSAYSQNCGGE